MSNKKGKLAACSAGSPLVFVNDNHDDDIKMKDNCLVNFTVLLKDNTVMTCDCIGVQV